MPVSTQVVRTGWNPDAVNGTQVGSCILEEPVHISSMGAVFLARQETFLATW